MTKGEQKMAIRKQEEKIEEERRRIESEKRDKLWEYAVEKICPECGKDLKRPEEVVNFTEGEWHLCFHFYIKCPCGYNFSTMTEQREMEAFDRYSSDECFGGI